MLTARWARWAQVCFTQLPWGSGGRDSGDEEHSLILAHRHTESKQNCVSKCIDMNYYHPIGKPRPMAGPQVPGHRRTRHPP